MKIVKVTAELITLFFFVQFNTRNISFASDIIIGASGVVSLQYISHDTGGIDAIHLFAPANAVIASTDCQVRDASADTGIPLFVANISTPNCTVVLDADASSTGIQPFDSGTVFQFVLCARQPTLRTECSYVYPSSPPRGVLDRFRVSGSDSFFMVTTDTWGDHDFNDVVFTLTVNGYCPLLFSTN